MFSANEKTQFREAELQRFWQITSLGWELIAADPDDPMLDELRDEIEIMAINTDWPVLRDQCLRLLKRGEELRPRHHQAAAQR